MSVGGYVRQVWQDVSTQIRRRFATKSSRFRLAVSSGFVLTAVSVLVMGADQRFGIAQSVWGLSFPGLGNPGFGGSGFEEAAPRPSAQYLAPHRRLHADRMKTSHPVREARRHRDDDDAGTPVHLARRSLCVRLCDGFVFPVGDYHGEGDRPAHEATCQSECPGAKTALFVVPSGSDSIGDAEQIGTGRNYSEMPRAFHYTTYVDEACTCHPRSGNRIKSLLRDFTLRRGDAVMTAKGMQIFHGAPRFPYTRRDFVALSRSRDVAKGDRESLRAIERASLPAPATIVETPPSVAARAQPGGTRDLVHQATN